MFFLQIFCLLVVDFSVDRMHLSSSKYVSFFRSFLLEFGIFLR